MHQESEVYVYVCRLCMFFFFIVLCFKLWLLMLPKAGLTFFTSTVSFSAPFKGKGSRFYSVLHGCTVQQRVSDSDPL